MNISPNQKPGHLKNHFVCPHCGVFSHFEWGVFENRCKPQSATPLADNIFVGFCLSCKEAVIFAKSKLVYPYASGIDPNPDMPDDAKDTFIEAQSILNRSPRGACVLLRLCLEQLLTFLGFHQNRLIDKINAAAPKGSVLENMLTATRLAGNKFVHEGKIESLQDPEFQPDQIAFILSQFINVATEVLVSIPNAAKRLTEEFSNKSS